MKLQWAMGNGQLQNNMELRWAYYNGMHLLSLQTNSPKRIDASIDHSGQPNQKPGQDGSTDGQSTER